MSGLTLRLLQGRLADNGKKNTVLKPQLGMDSYDAAWNQLSQKDKKKLNELIERG